MIFIKLKRRVEQLLLLTLVILLHLLLIEHLLFPSKEREHHSERTIIPIELASLEEASLQREEEHSPLATDHEELSEEENLPVFDYGETVEESESATSLEGEWIDLIAIERARQEELAREQAQKEREEAERVAQIEREKREKILEEERRLPIETRVQRIIKRCYVDAGLERVGRNRKASILILPDGSFRLHRSTGIEAIDRCALEIAGAQLSDPKLLKEMQRSLPKAAGGSVLTYTF